MRLDQPKFVKLVLFSYIKYNLMLLKNNIIKKKYVVICNEKNFIHKNMLRLQISAIKTIS